MAVKGTPLCTFHTPGNEARARGGRNSHTATRVVLSLVPSDAPDLPLKTRADVADALEVVFNEVRRGKLAPQIGNCLAVIANTLLNARDDGEVEQRVAELEERAAAKAGRRVG
jgi:hypothetical protein